MTRKVAQGEQSRAGGRCAIRTIEGTTDVNGFLSHRYAHFSPHHLESLLSRLLGSTPRVSDLNQT